MFLSLYPVPSAWYTTMGYHIWHEWLCALAYNLAIAGSFCWEKDFHRQWEIQSNFSKYAIFLQSDELRAIYSYANYKEFS